MATMITQATDDCMFGILELSLQPGQEIYYSYKTTASKPVDALYTRKAGVGAG
jgi:hypothetical protein